MRISELSKRFPSVQFQTCAGAVGAYHEGRNYGIGSLVAEDTVALNQVGTDLINTLTAADIEAAVPKAKPKKAAVAAEPPATVPEVPEVPAIPTLADQ